MSDEQDKLKRLSLEPPKLFGRKKKSDAARDSKRTSPAAEEPTAAAPEPEPGPEPAPEPEAPPDPAPAPQKTTGRARPAPARKTAPKTASGGATSTSGKPGTKTAARTDNGAAQATEQAAAEKPARRPVKPSPPVEPEPVTGAELEDADIAAVARADEPLLTIYWAAALTGAVAGAAMVVLTWLSLRGCEAVRGTASCGGGPGLVLLVATFVVCVLLGSTLLKTFLIPDPGSTSFLAVGVVAVVALLFLIDVLDHWSMLVVVPVVSVGAYLASVWVTKTFVDPADT